MGHDVDHHSHVGDDGRRVWTRSHCGKRGHWTKRWGFCGRYEGRVSGQPEIWFVACSPECKAALCGERESADCARCGP